MAQPEYKPHERSPLAPCPMDRSVTFVKSECGCTVEGCGHLPDPVRPKLCAKHSAAPDLYAALAELSDLCPRMNEDDPIGPAIRDAIMRGRAALKKADGHAA